MDSGSGDMATIRTIRPTDLISLVAFFRDGSHQEVTARVWPEVWGNSNTRAVWHLVSRLITRPGDSHAWVCLANGGVSSLGVARPRPGKLAWDVEDLFVAEGRMSAAVDLLEHVATETARRGGRRVFLSTPADDDLARIAKQAGFVNYTSETLCTCPSPAAASDIDLPRPRPRLRQDTQALFQLYNAAVPCRVRSAEAVTLDEWMSLQKGGRLWAPSIGGSRQHFVWENGNTVTGWLQLSSGAKSQHLELLVHPSHLEELDAMVEYSLGLLNPRVPAYASARDYQPELLSALERWGFTGVADCLVFSRELTVRVPTRALVPAGA